MQKTAATKYTEDCPLGSMCPDHGTESEKNCDHCFECPDCGASDLCHEDHDTDCQYAPDGEDGDDGDDGSDEEDAIARAYSEVVARWHEEEKRYIVLAEETPVDLAAERWISADGDNWTDGNGREPKGDFEKITILLRGGARNNEVVS